MNKRNLCCKAYLYNDEWCVTYEWEDDDPVSDSACATPKVNPDALVETGMRIFLSIIWELCKGWQELKALRPLDVEVEPLKPEHEHDRMAQLRSTPVMAKPAPTVGLPSLRTAAPNRIR